MDNLQQVKKNMISYLYNVLINDKTMNKELKKTFKDKLKKYEDNI